MPKLPIRDWQKTLQATRTDVSKPVRMTVAGSPADIDTFVRGLGAAVDTVTALPLPAKSLEPVATTDLVIVIIGAGESPGEAAREVINHAKRYSVEYLAALNRVNLSGARLEEVMAETADFLAVAPRRVAVFLPIQSFASQRQLLRQIADAVPEKELALAARLPVLRDVVIERRIRQTSQQNAVLGMLSIVPGSDMPVLTANQIKMVMEIAAVFGAALTWARAKEILAVVGGGFTLRAVARQLLDLVPGAGWLLKGAVAYTGTRAVGELAARYFAAGEQE